MFSNNKLIDVFNDTLNWIKTDKALSDSVIHSIDNTKVYFDAEYPRYDKRTDCDTKILVTKDKSFQAAMRLSKENPGKRIAVMNFANAVVSGGGVTRGSRAQEESLCRTSTLYPVIARPAMWDSYYAYHRDLNDPRASDALIYSEDIIICKTDDDIPVRLPREEWTNVDVITIAAPNLRSNRFPGFTVSDEELFAIHVKRAIHMLSVAASKRVDILVLGAFGCGAFCNDPEIVSKAYKVALDQFEGAFEKVEFAVFCNEYETVNYEVFKKTLINEP